MKNDVLYPCLPFPKVIVGYVSLKTLLMYSELLIRMIPVMYAQL